MKKYDALPPEQRPADPSTDSAYMGNIFGIEEPKKLNRNLHKAKKNKNDEFYTQIDDIERELKHYRKHFKNKVVFCNCDDPDWSAFTKYFALNFDVLKLKKLICTHYEEGKVSYKLEITKQVNSATEIRKLPRVPLKGDGDFRSEECIELLKESDIVCTNPPFSLFREYIAQLIAHEKKFLIIGHQNAIVYKEVFPLIRNGGVWLGYGFKGGATHFINRHYEDYATAGDHREGMIRVSGVHWFTNLTHKKRNEKLILVKRYQGNEENYPHYDNYDAINVDKTKDIPLDYEGFMGVPITFMDKYNPDQFEIIWLACGHSKTTMPEHIKEEVKFNPDVKSKHNTGGYGIVNGVQKYHRILIRRRQKDED